MAIDLSTLDKAFIRKLKEFAKHGYAFDAKHSLRKGTRQDLDAQGTQREAFDAYIQGIEEGHRHGYFEIPTGVGKTALFISLAKNYIDAVNSKKEDQRTLIVVPNVKLAIQTAQALAKFLPELAPTIETDDDQGKEIDWESSNIGLQYGKVKHADRKPQILITTYQSLNNDRADKTYPPKEYGMVIYDEGHAITADQYGKAVDKFQNSIQLAVSATPEYSEEKTVSSRLAHRYYHLPISEAVNRGDLCNVRPVLLKTNFTVDKKKFREFSEARRGKNLSNDQLTKLLNEQSRNQAAMLAYLMGSDPDSGEHYLGQNGMIFCGSTDHVDDFVRQFNDLIDKPKYRPVKQWLKDEKIELIAPIHGKIKGSLLKKGLLTNGGGKSITEGRRYEGNKEWYSEEEIFDLHAKGKILLLSSVKKLKEGYDSPRDSIIIDTVDRLSKVDATQIDGRGFRLNPPDSQNNDPGDPDKTCTVINMVDKNTHELYADEPLMLPIYCAEVIEGAEFRTPAKRKHLIKTFSKEPPNLQRDLESADFKLITDMQVVRDISTKNKEKRDDAKKKRKPPKDWLSPDQISKRHGGKGQYHEKNLLELHQNLLTEWKSSRTAEESESLIKREWMDYYGKEGEMLLFASPLAIKTLIEKGKVAPITEEESPAKRGWWSITKIKNEYGGSDEKLAEILDEYENAKIAEITTKVKDNKKAKAIVASDWVTTWKRGSISVKYISQEGLDELIERKIIVTDRDQLPDAPDGWLSGKMLQDTYGGSTATYNAVIIEFRDKKIAELKRKGMDAGKAELKVSEQWAGYYKKSGTKVLLISPKGFAEIKDDLVKKDMKSIGEAPAEWVSVNMLEHDSKYGRSQGKPFKQVFEEYQEQKISSLAKGKVKRPEAEKIVHDEWIGEYKKSGKSSLYISPKGLDEVIEQKGIILKSNKAIAPKVWASVADLMQTYKGADRVIKEKLEQFRDNQVQKLQSGGTSKADAEAEVHTKWVGHYYRTSEASMAGIYASPVAVKAMVAEGTFVSKIAPRKSPTEQAAEEREKKKRGGHDRGD